MSITDFVGLFDKQKVSEGKIRFTFLPRKKFPFKFMCKEGEDADSLINSIRESPVSKYEIIGAEEMHFNGRYDYVVVMVQLVYRNEGGK